MAFFSEHLPTEFERTQHCLRTTNGIDIEPLAVLTAVPPASLSVVDSVASIQAAVRDTTVSRLLVRSGIYEFEAGMAGPFASGAQPLASARGCVRCLPPAACRPPFARARHRTSPESRARQITGPFAS